MQQRPFMLLYIIREKLNESLNKRRKSFAFDVKKHFFCSQMQHFVCLPNIFCVSLRAEYYY